MSAFSQDDGATQSIISARIAEITPADKNIPENPVLLDDELRRINQELDEARKSAAQYERQLKSLNKNKESGSP